MSLRVVSMAELRLEVLLEPEKTASDSMAWIRCAYVSMVTAMLAWPRRSLTTFGWTPACNASEAYVYRTSCRRIAGSPGGGDRELPLAEPCAAA